MAWTFGAANTHRFNVNTGVSIGASSRTGFICGWWKPATLTAGLGYWSVSTPIFARIATTTSEIELGTNNTTPGLWTTSGAGIAVNNWYFIAFMLSTLNGTPSAAWRVWVGTELKAPNEITVNVNTTPAGNFTGATGVILGQVGSTGTVSFIGDISDCAVIAQATNTTGPLRTAAYGAITQNEADFVRDRVVLPYWSGIPFPQEVYAMAQGNAAYDACYVPMSAGYPGAALGIPTPHITTTTGSPSQTSAGAGGLSKGLTGGPREFYANAAAQLQRVRR